MENGTIEWKRPSGSKLETNDLPGTIAHCEALGWKKGKHTPASMGEVDLESDENEAE